MTATTNITLLWIVTPCSLAEVYRYFGTLKMEAARSSESSVSIYQSARRHIARGSSIYFLRVYVGFIYFPEVRAIYLYTFHDLYRVFVCVFLLPCLFRTYSGFICTSYIDSCVTN
jgi:hypothetical protein